MPLEYSTPRQLGDSQFYTQLIWDEENKNYYIAICTKNADDTFSVVSSSSKSDLIKAKEKQKKK